MIEELKLFKESKILILGCGNSEFSEELYDFGYKNIYNIDISENVIKSMKERNIKRDKMKCNKSLKLKDEIMDVLNIEYPDNYFDIVIDKSTIDVMFCGENSSLNMAIMTKEVQRVLKKNKIYFVVSFGAPESRAIHFEREHLSFDIKIFTLKKDVIYKGNKIEKVFVS